MSWGPALYFIDGEEGAGSAFLSGEVVRNKIFFNLLSLGNREVVSNFNDSDGSCKRCLVYSLNLNSDGDDELTLEEEGALITTHIQMVFLRGKVSISC
jgi:hypothetical protein